MVESSSPLFGASFFISAIIIPLLLYRCVPCVTRVVLLFFSCGLSSVLHGRGLLHLEGQNKDRH